MKKILRNAIQCNYCGVVLESTHVHDYRTHECKKGPIIGKQKKWIDDPDAPGGMRLVDTEEDAHPFMMVDGGLSYIRRGGDPQHHTVLDQYEET